MNQLMNNQKAEMTSREIADLVGARHDSVKRTIERLSSGVISEPPLVDGARSANGIIEKVYLFFGEKGKLDSIVVIAQLCPEFTARLVERWDELEKANAQPKLPTHNEAFLQLFQSAVEQDRVIKEQNERLIAVENKLEKAIEANVWDHCPQNCEPITKIRTRINERYGISAKIVDQVMRDMPFSPRIAGMVRNGNENAQGAHYAVYHTKDVSNVFKMFVSECEQVTKEFFKHQLISKSFKLKV